MEKMIIDEEKTSVRTLKLPALTIRGREQKRILTIVINISILYSLVLLSTLPVLNAEQVIGEVQNSNLSRSDTRESTRVPSPPRDVTVTVDGAKCIIRWNVPEDYGGGSLSMFRIYRGKSEKEHVLIIDQINTPLNDRYKVDLTTEPNTRYYYWVTALNHNGESNLSKPAKVTTQGPNGPPGTIGSKVGKKWVELFWISSNRTNTNLKVTNVLQRSLDNVVFIDLSIIESDPLDLIKYNDSFVMMGETYWYRIVFRVDQVLIVPLKTVAIKFFGPPTRVSELHSRTTRTSVTLIWDRPGNDGGADIQGYIIKKGPNYESGTEVDRVPPDRTTWKDPEPFQDGTSFYSVIPYNTYGEGDNTLEVVYNPKKEISQELTIFLLILFIGSTVPGLLATGIAYKENEDKNKRDEHLKNFDKKNICIERGGMTHKK